MADKNNMSSDTAKLSREEKQAKELADKKQTYLDYAETYRKKLQADKERAARKAEREQMKKLQELKSDIEASAAQASDAKDGSQVDPSAAEDEAAERMLENMKKKIAEAEEKKSSADVAMPDDGEAAEVVAQEERADESAETENIEEAESLQSAEVTAAGNSDLPDLNNAAEASAEPVDGERSEPFDVGSVEIDGMYFEGKSVPDSKSKPRSDEPVKPELDEHMQEAMKTSKEAFDAYKKRVDEYNEAYKKSIDEHNQSVAAFNKKMEELRKKHIDDYMEAASRAEADASAMAKKLREDRIRYNKELMELSARRNAMARDYREKKRQLQREIDDYSVRNGQLAEVLEKTRAEADKEAQLREAAEARIEELQLENEKLALQNSSLELSLAMGAAAPGARAFNKAELSSRLRAGEEKRLELAVRMGDIIATSPENDADKLSSLVDAIAIKREIIESLAEDLGSVRLAGAPEEQTKRVSEELNNSIREYNNLVDDYKALTGHDLTRPDSNMVRKILMGEEPSPLPTVTKKNELVSKETGEVVATASPRAIKNATLRVDTVKDGVHTSSAVSGDGSAKDVPITAVAMSLKAIPDELKRTKVVENVYKEKLSALDSASPTSTEESVILTVEKLDVQRRLIESLARDIKLCVRIEDEKKIAAYRRELEKATQKYNELANEYYAITGDKLTPADTTMAEKIVNGRPYKSIPTISYRKEGVDGSVINESTDFSATAGEAYELLDAKSKQRLIKKRIPINAPTTAISGVSDKQARAMLSEERSKLKSDAGSVLADARILELQAREEKKLAKGAKRKEERAARLAESDALYEKSLEKRTEAEERLALAKSLKGLDEYERYLQKKNAKAEKSGGNEALKDAAAVAAGTAMASVLDEELEKRKAGYEEFDGLSKREKKSRIMAERTALLTEANTLKAASDANIEKANAEKALAKEARTKSERDAHKSAAKELLARAKEEKLLSDEKRREANSLKNETKYKEYVAKQIAESELAVAEGKAAAEESDASGLTMTDREALAKELEAYKRFSKETVASSLPLAEVSTREAEERMKKERATLLEEAAMLAALAKHDEDRAAASAKKLARANTEAERAVHSLEEEIYLQKSAKESESAKELEKDAKTLKKLDDYESYLLKKSEKKLKESGKEVTEDAVRVEKELEQYKSQEAAASKFLPLANMPRKEAKRLLAKERDLLIREAKHIDEAADYDARCAQYAKNGAKYAPTKQSRAEKLEEREKYEQSSRNKRVLAAKKRDQAKALTGLEAFERYLIDVKIPKVQRRLEEEYGVEHVSCEEAFERIKEELLSTEEPLHGVRRGEMRFMLKAERDSIKAQAKVIRSASIADGRSAREALLDVQETSDELKRAIARSEAEALKQRSAEKKAMYEALELDAEKLTGKRAYKEYLKASAAATSANADIAGIDGNVTVEEARFIPYDGLTKEQLQAHIKTERDDILREVAQLREESYDLKCEARRLREAASLIENKNAKEERISEAEAIEVQSEQKSTLADEKLMLADSFKSVKAYKKLIDKSAPELRQTKEELEAEENDELKVASRLAMTDGELSSTISDTRLALAKEAADIEADAAKDSCEAEYVKALAKKERSKEKRVEGLALAEALSRRSAAKSELSKQRMLEAKSLKDAKSYEKYLTDKANREVSLYNYEAQRILDSNYEIQDAKGALSGLSSYEANLMLEKEKASLEKNAGVLEYSAYQDAERAKELRLLARNEKSHYERNAKYEQALGLEELSNQKKAEAERMRTCALEIKDIDSYEKYLESNAMRAASKVGVSKTEKQQPEAKAPEKASEQKSKKLSRREALQRMVNERNELLLAAAELENEAKTEIELARQYKRDAKEAKSYHARNRSYEEALRLEAGANRKRTRANEKRAMALELRDINAYEKYLEAKGMTLAAEGYAKTPAVDEPREKQAEPVSLKLSASELKQQMQKERDDLERESAALVLAAKADRARAASLKKQANTEAEDAKRIAKYEEAASLSELANTKYKSAVRKRIDASELKTISAYERYLSKKNAAAKAAKKTTEDYNTTAYDKEMQKRELLGAKALVGVPKEEIYARMLSERDALIRDALALESEAKSDKARVNAINKLAKESKNELEAARKYEEAKSLEELANAKYKVSVEKRTDAVALVDVAAYEKYLDKRAAIAYAKQASKAGAATTVKPVGEAFDTTSYDKEMEKRELLGVAPLVGVSRNEAYARMQAERILLGEEAKALELAAYDDAERANELKTLARFEKDMALAEAERENARILAERGATKRIVAAQKKKDAATLTNLKAYERYLDSKAEKANFINTYNEISASYEKENYTKEATAIATASTLELREGARRERAALIAEADALEAASRVDVERAKEAKLLAKYEKHKYEREAKRALSETYIEKSRAKKLLADEKRQVAGSFRSLTAYEKYLENKELLEASKTALAYSSEDYSAENEPKSKGSLKSEMQAERNKLSREASALQLAALEDYERSKELRALAKSDRNKSSRKVKNYQADSLERQSAAKKVLAEDKRNTAESLKDVKAYEEYLKEREILAFSENKKPLSEAKVAYDAKKRETEEKTHLAVSSLSSRELKSRVKSEREELRSEARELESSARIDEYRAKEERKLAKSGTKSAARIHEETARTLDDKREDTLRAAKLKLKEANELKDVKAYEKYLVEREMKRAVEKRDADIARAQSREVISIDKYEKYLAVREEIDILRTENDRVINGQLSKKELKARLEAERYELAMESERLQREGLDELRLAKTKRALAKHAIRAEREKLISEALEHENYSKSALELAREKEKEAKRIAKDAAEYDKYLANKSAIEAVKLERARADIDRRLEAVKPEEMRMDMENALKMENQGEPQIEYDKKQTEEYFREQSERDEQVVTSRIETKLISLSHDISIDKLHFGDRSTRSKRETRANKSLFKKLKHRLKIAEKLEAADNKRYYTVAKLDIDKLKLPKGVKRDAVLTLKVELERLLKERDNINKELLTLYEGNREFEKNGLSNTEKRLRIASRRAKRSYKKQCKLANQIEELHISVNEKMKVFEPMNRITALDGEIASLEYQIKREKLTKRARQTAKRRLKSKIRIRNKLANQVQRTANRVKRKAEKQRRERAQQIRSIILLLALIAACVFGYIYRAEIVAYIKEFLGGLL